jgi:large subunit ribosomal protein L32
MWRLMREGRDAETKIEQARSTKMAVQQNKKSPSKRGMHRAHDFLTSPPLAVEPTTGEAHLRHHISPSGYYRGKKIVKSKAE